MEKRLLFHADSYNKGEIYLIIAITGRKSTGLGDMRMLARTSD
jgi:hypothetical protein